MPQKVYSDDEVFGAKGAGRVYSDDEVFGGAAPAAEPLSWKQAGRDFMGGIEDTKSLGAGAGAFFGAANYGAQARLLEDMDAVDSGGTPIARQGGRREPARPSDLARLYQQAAPDERATMRKQAQDQLVGSREFVSDMAKAVEAYKDEKLRLSGQMPDLRDVRSVSDFATFLGRHIPAATPTMAASMASAALGGIPGLVLSSGGMALGDITGDRLDYASQVYDPKRFTSADRAADAMVAQKDAVARHLAENTGRTAVAAVPYVALDFLGPAAAVAKGEVKSLAQQGLKGFLKGGAKQTLEETINEGGQKVVNIGAEMAADERPAALTADDAWAVANEAVVGGAMGFGGHAVSSGTKSARDAMRNRISNQEPPVIPPTPGAEPTPADAGGSVLAPPASAAPIPAADVLGRVEPPSEAEKALTTEPTPLRPERIAAVPGLPTSFSTEAGARLDGQYALVEADQVIAPHDTNLRPNADYPAELQPNARTRADSEAQISSIVGKLDPARLGESATVGEGAPIIGEDGLVESGKARTTALQRVYRANGQKAQDYKAWLRSNAESFGLDPAAIDSMAQPMLVRVRTTPVNRPEFARQANAPVAVSAPATAQAAQAAQAGDVQDVRAPASPEVDGVLRSIERSRAKLGEAVTLEAFIPEGDTADVPQRLAAALGAPVVFARTVSGPQNFSGVNVKGTVVLMTNGNDAPIALTAHEVVHGMPQDIKQSLITALQPHMKRERFVADFPNYAPEKIDEEITARLAQQHAKTPEFWAEIRKNMGEGDFAKLAQHILAKLDELIAKFKGNDLTRYATDVEQVRAALAKAMTETARRNDDTKAEEPPIDYAEERGRKEQHGQHTVRVFKDGSIRVEGDGPAIRALMPENIKGRITSAGMEFTNSDAPRVRAALEGRNVAYSRAGEVTDRLPMKDGKYLGAPKKYDKPGNISILRKSLRRLTKEGEAGRFWYENSGREVLRMVGGDVKEARKFLALLAIYSPQAKVDTNSTFALRAWAQYKAGQKISVKTGVMDKKAQHALEDVDAFWSGEKTGNFVTNLLRIVDPTLKQGATIDMWMMRAAEYENDAPTKTQYAFMENETNRIAAELGWEPQQVQAAIWVAMKARMENAGVKKATEAKSAKRGWIRYDDKVNPETGKKSKVRVILDAQKHRDNWLEHAFAHDPTKQDTKAAKFDFSDGLRRHIGQISFEARPGRTTGVLPGIHDAPWEQQVEFQQAVQAAFLDEDGQDMLAHKLGLLTDGDEILPGVWQNEVSPSEQKSIAMAPAKGEEGKGQVDPAQKQALNAYTAIAGLLARQEGVGWHRPFYSATKRDSNGLDIDIGRPLKPLEARELAAAVGKWMNENGRATFTNWKGEVVPWDEGLAFISSPYGIRLVSFGAVENAILQKELFAVAESVLPDFTAQWFKSDGDMPSNNWMESPNGQGYVARASAEGASDVLGWARIVLAPRVQQVFERFAEEYQWGDPGRINFSEDARPAEPARGSGVGSDEGARFGRRISGAVHYSTQAGLEILSGRAFGSGIRGAEQARLAQPGVDPRIKRRVYFYLPTDGGVPAPEAGLGGHVYTANLSRMYDAATNPAVKGDTPNAFESAVLDAGYNGYLNREQGTAVVLNDNVRVQYVGPASEQKKVARNNERIVPKVATRREGEELVRRVANDEMIGVIKARPALAKLAPSFKLQFGEARVLADEAPAANASLAEAGSSVQFSEDLFPDEFADKSATVNVGSWKAGNVNSAGQKIAGTKQGLQNFWGWFGNSEAIDDDSRPLALYHATNGNFDRFEVARATSNNYGFLGDVEVRRAGIFLTPDVDFSQEYLRSGDGKNVMPVYLKIERPLDLRSGLTEADEAALEKGDISVRWIHNIQHHWELFDADDGGKNHFVDALQSLGYDGAIFNETSPSGEGRFTTYVAFGPKQIKSAFNVGTFNAADPRVNFSDDAAGSVAMLSRAAAPTFYSALARTVDAAQMKSAPAEGWKQFLKGQIAKGAIKADEVEWSGVNEWLDMQQGKVTREAVAEYLQANGVQVTETVLGEREPWRQRMDMLETRGSRNLSADERAELDILRDRFDMEGRSTDNDATETKYNQYTLPGGTNYREVLLTLPKRGDAAARTKRLAEIADEIADTTPERYAELHAERARLAAEYTDSGDSGYRSSHWDQPNVLAHIRLNDRVDADGAKVLFVEELQADWQSARRKQDAAISKAVDADFAGIIKRMEAAGVLTVECD